MLVLLLVSIYGEHILFCVFICLFYLCVSFLLQRGWLQRRDLITIFVKSVRKQQCVGAGTLSMVVLIVCCC